jgi:hypothetical protein
MRITYPMWVTTCVIICCLGSGSVRSEDGWSARVPTPAIVNERKLAKITPGVSTKAQVQSLLGSPWRIVQFNDCGGAMPGQADETWDYRGRDAKGTYRLHIEFDDQNVAHLVAKIPDYVDGGKATAATVAPGAAKMAMKM